MAADAPAVEGPVVPAAAPAEGGRRRLTVSVDRLASGELATVHSFMTTSIKMPGSRDITLDMLDNNEPI